MSMQRECNRVEIVILGLISVSCRVSTMAGFFLFVFPFHFVAKGNQIENRLFRVQLALNFFLFLHFSVCIICSGFRVLFRLVLFAIIQAFTPPTHKIQSKYRQPTFSVVSEAAFCCRFSCWFFLLFFLHFCISHR